MLLVLNELKNCDDDILANFDSLKSLITDAPLRVNEKNQSRSDAQNVANFIFVTNNSFLVKIEASNRRYLVLAFSGDRVGQHGYFKHLLETFTDEFYFHLLTYFMNIDLTDFVIRNIPVTKAKQDLIEASRPVIHSWIMEHYDELVV
jgi:phage/plasmid-associated DNA primase